MPDDILTQVSHMRVDDDEQREVEEKEEDDEDEDGEGVDEGEEGGGSGGEDGEASDDDSNDGSDDDAPPPDPSLWLPALQASQQLGAHLTWRMEALPELAMLRLSLAEAPAAPLGGSSAEPADEPLVSAPTVSQGVGRFVLYVDAAAPFELLCDIGGLQPCLWEADVARALAQLTAW
ncbi:hypothetical protein T492DRAFT_867110 [Pavlovales sp. CCMP2436]|nr:hypothetical protein T492DRAFT_867110 [Pavlovales sp. CCMP2436]